MPIGEVARQLVGLRTEADEVEQRIRAGLRGLLFTTGRRRSTKPSRNPVCMRPARNSGSRRISRKNVKVKGPYRPMTTPNAAVNHKATIRHRSCVTIRARIRRNPLVLNRLDT